MIGLWKVQCIVGVVWIWNSPNAEVHQGSRLHAGAVWVLVCRIIRRESSPQAWKSTPCTTVSQQETALLSALTTDKTSNTPSELMVMTLAAVHQVAADTHQALENSPMMRFEDVKVSTMEGRRGESHGTYRGGQ